MHFTFLPGPISLLFQEKLLLQFGSKKGMKTIEKCTAIIKDVVKKKYIERKDF